MDKKQAFRLELSRRHALKSFGVAAIAGLAIASPSRILAKPVFRQYPFTLGIASGDPSPDGFVIWTRLAPDPFALDYGMPMAAVEVGYEVATDRGFRDVVRKGMTLARPELGHSVHVELSGLDADRDYYYRFTSGDERTYRGRARTTPAIGASVDRLRFAVAGCQNYEEGYYTAYRHLAEENPDFVYCYGDYIYEYRDAPVRHWAGPVASVRRHFEGEVQSIGDYRRRYAQYKMDIDLQRAHAAAPWLTVWDDHEIDNNWVSHLDQDGTPPELFRLRQQMAMQAYYEHMPLRAASLPVGASMQIYRHMPWGNLADINLLDTRQFRSDQPCNDSWGADCDDVRSRDADVLGQRQLDWLLGNMGRSEATWQVLAQQIMMMDLDRMPDQEGLQVNPDSWGGYQVPRARLLEELSRRGHDSTIVLTGDEHQHFAGNLYEDGTDRAGSPIATEFVTTSITSGGDGELQRADMREIQAANPQLVYNNYQRGYAICDVTRDQWTTHHRVVEKVSERGAPISTAASFAVAPGSPGVQRA
ncbi:alkaline phosphatase D family protein [Sphingomicrobium sediminis]|uniref:Alkaline phosphatase D family protein n=1 Tax=Sphingomicrobium sediminis TaxID=2950949 RepID=A0A9X2EJC7_9SPHN|nr:alkaline phosphatase D family protein [Sphingomicrobium sediminis]MCM8556337.1 alkaline phosphatase D family protein [Sphingomicrobium sediminis]